MEKNLVIQLNKMSSAHTKKIFSDAEKVSAPSGNDWHELPTKIRRTASATINKTAGTITLYFEGLTAPETISYTETDTSMTFSWPDGFSTTVSIS